PRPAGERPARAAPGRRGAHRPPAPQKPAGDVPRAPGLGAAPGATARPAALRGCPHGLPELPDQRRRAAHHGGQRVLREQFVQGSPRARAGYLVPYRAHERMKYESHLPVLIVGAGPIGLTAAMLLARQGVPSTVLEAGPDICRVGSRAVVVQRATLET